MIKYLEADGTALIPGYISNFDMIKYNSSDRLPKDKSLRQIYFLKDTGANVTTISRESLIGLGYSNEYINKEFIPNANEAHLASGTVRIGRIRVPIFQIEGREFRNYEMFVIHYDEFAKGKDLNNLFGLDFARYFNYREIFETWEFELLPNYPQKSIRYK